MSSILRTLGAIIVVLLCGHFQACGLPSRFAVTLRNGTEMKLYDVKASWDSFSYWAGTVSVGGGKTEAFPDASFPRLAVVEWRTEDGVEKSVEVNVALAVGRRSRWANVELVFLISDDGVVEVFLEKGP